jgi:hypothetical protein
MQTLLKSAQEDPAVISALQRHHTAEYEVFQSYAKNSSSPHTLEYLIRQTAFNFLSAFLLGRRSVDIHG